MVLELWSNELIDWTQNGMSLNFFYTDDSGSVIRDASFRRNLSTVRFAWIIFFANSKFQHILDSYIMAAPNEKAFDNFVFKAAVSISQE